MCEWGRGLDHGYVLLPSNPVFSGLSPGRESYSGISHCDTYSWAAADKT